jgi:hypothetical protein
MDLTTLDNDIAAECLRASAASAVDPELEPQGNVWDDRRQLRERLGLMPFRKCPPDLDAERAVGVGHVESLGEGASR